ncbi:MAG TPA: hypothetical protein VGK88_11880 [bacterium]|jgi:hypothetical protein
MTDLTAGLLGLAAAIAVAAWRLRVGFVGFRERFRAYLAGCPDIVWRTSTVNGFVCAVSGVSLEVDLLESYVYRLRRRGDEAELFGRVSAGLRHRVPPATPPPFPLVRDRVLPLIKREADLIMSRGYRTQHVPVRSPWAAGLVVAYVIEDQFQMTYVTEGMMSAWGIGTADLHRLAIENLRAHTQHLLDELGGPQADYIELDGYEAARVLAADLIIPHQTRAPILAIPHEHACLTGSADRSEVVAGRALAMYDAADHPLTPMLFSVSAAGVVPYDGPQRPGAASEASEAQSQIEA